MADNEFTQGIKQVMREVIAENVTPEFSKVNGRIDQLRTELNGRIDETNSRLGRVEQDVTDIKQNVTDLKVLVEKIADSLGSPHP